MTPEELAERLRGSTNWYHRIRVGDAVTPGQEALVPQWDMMREARALHAQAYPGTRVLDIASYDGMWAFEAEELGARLVVAVDCCPMENFSHFLQVRALLKSSVLPFYNVNAYNIAERLDCFLASNGRFDIVQHLGLLYHCRDPLWTLGQARKVIRENGLLFLETAVCVDTEPVMLFNGPDRRVYNDVTTWWVPSVSCLGEMLAMTGFTLDKDSLCFLRQTDRVQRCACWARAQPADEIDPELLDEFRHTHRTPGVEI